jgi:ring-1,2-phenylacetyl-CoA epoxidase subunit PaaA
MPPESDLVLQYRIKTKDNEALRQEFLDGYVPQIRELGLEIPDPELRYDEGAGLWRYTEPDWDELRRVVSGHGPASEDRLGLRRRMRDANAWVRRAVLADAA